MRIGITILLFFVYSSVQAQDMLNVAMEQLNTALIRKDTVLLNSLVHTDVTYGHSNGWIESKADMKANLYNGKLAYNSIGQQVTEILKEANMACVRSNATIEVTYEGRPMTFQLHVLQVWTKKDKNWQLVARQSVKIG
jgi:hypothetical protein